MIEVTAHGIVGRPGFVALADDVGGFELQVRPGRWIGSEAPMSVYVTVHRDDCGWLEGIYLPGVSVIVVGNITGEEEDGKTSIRLHASELIKSDATDDEGRVRHQFIRGHITGRIKRPPQYSDRFCNFNVLSWAERSMTLFDCKISGAIEVANFRRRCHGEGTRVSLTGNVREHRFTDRVGISRNKLAFDVDEWEVLR